jgi:esterase/lipase superfamily enzyme
MTLYASSLDKALQVSKTLAQKPRAGDVPDTGPVTLLGLDTIDVSPLGSNWFALGHSGYAEKRNVLNDLASLLKNGLRPPSLRTAEIRGWPEGQKPPAYWRYAAV